MDREGGGGYIKLRPKGQEGAQPSLCYRQRKQQAKSPSGENTLNTLSNKAILSTYIF